MQQCSSKEHQLDRYQAYDQFRQIDITYLNKIFILYLKISNLPIEFAYEALEFAYRIFISQ